MVIASELRIGNYINGGGTLRKVISIDLDGCISEPIDDTETDYSKGVEPIPLTEEWLLKFGFKSDEIMFEKDGFCIGWYKGDKFHYLPTGNIMIRNKREIKYVHQLQNLFFALHEQELTV